MILMIDVLIMLILRRYFMLELIPKKAISKDDLPPFLYTWSDLFSPTCMFNSYQMKTWTSAHLCGAGWYLECGLKHIPEAEQTLYHPAENAKDVILLDENDGSMDEAARAKAIAKIHAQDLKKKENLKALFEKELAKEEARKAKEAKKNQLKAEKGKGKKAKGGCCCQHKRLCGGGRGSKQPCSKEVGKKRGSPLISFTQERLTQGPVIVEVADDAELANDELFLNFSFGSLLPEDKPALPAFQEISSFLDKVLLICHNAFLPISKFFTFKLLVIIL